MQTIAPLVDAVGSQKALADELGISQSMVSHLFTGRYPASSDLAVRIELAAAQRGIFDVPAESLCPDVTWARIPDPSWPHPAGRPCIDVAAAKEASHA